jgi:putative PIG3 family NAD(P)H quinone oxidoreductase
MRAIIISQPGAPDVLDVREVPAPSPASGEVLVRVRAAGLNRADLLQRQGRYPAPPGVPADIPGLEFAGEVAQLGPDVSRWRAGRRVFGIVAGGAHAEYLVAHQHTLAEIPSNLDWTAAAAIPEVFITAHDAMLKQAALRPGETVLIHAVGSGVGLAAVQLARAFGAVPYGTARTADKIERARAIGLEDGVLLSSSLGPLSDATQRWTSGRGFDVILDLVGGPYVAASVDVLALKGRLMLIATSAGRRAEFDLARVLSRRVTLRGTVLRARPLEEKIAVTKAFAEEVVPLFAAGGLHANIDSVFPFADVRAAHQRLESNQTFGKVVLTFD